MATDLVNRFTIAVLSSTMKTEIRPTGDFAFADVDIWRDLPAAFAFVLPAQNEHREAVEG